MGKVANITDLVLEGGGVKGIGLVGAMAELESRGYQFRRIGGTSAGAVVGALSAAGMSTDDIHQLLLAFPYEKLRDKSLLDRFGLIGRGLSLLFEKGVYEGNYLREFMLGQLEQLGVQTWADLKINDPWCQDYPVEQRYKLVVIAADITRGRLVRLPWDYRDYGLDPDEQLVADSVRASASIPFFYEPVKIGSSYFVDGGIVSNFPLAVLDQSKSGVPRWPTIGINISSQDEDALQPNDTSGPIKYSRALLETIINGRDRFYISKPDVVERTIFVDTSMISATNFKLTQQQRMELFDNGMSAARKFMSSWDFTKYKKLCYGKKVR